MNTKKPELQRRNRRRFYVITALALAVMFAVAIGIVIYLEYSYVKVEVTGSPHASFTVAYDSTNQPVPVSENLTVVVLPHVNLTIAAIPDLGYSVSSWSVIGSSGYHEEPNGSVIYVETGSGGSAIQVAVRLTNSANG